MLDTLQHIALCFLWKEYEGNTLPEKNLRQWFINKKINDQGCFFSYLVEPQGQIDKYYTLSADSEKSDIAILESYDVGSLSGEIAKKLPFNKPSGSQSAQIGPVIKRSYSQKKGSGPSLKILNTTISSFEKLMNSKMEWAVYFKEVVDVFKRKKIKFEGNTTDCEKYAFHEAIKIIPDKDTVFLAYKTPSGNLPGDVASYKKYLSTKLDAHNKYTTKKAPSKQINKCPLCNYENVECYSAGISKAGINIFNIDRHGAFPGITNENAHLSYAVCENCADLLYIFKFHFINHFVTSIAGQETLIIPELYSEPNLIIKFLDSFNSYIEKLKTTPDKAIISEKKKLIKLLSKQNAICTIDMFWSKDSLKGQSLQNLSGHISDILPSRLRKIKELNDLFKTKELPFFPIYILDEFEFDLNLSFISDLFKRPGGRAAKNINSSRKLIELKRLIAECIYKKKIVPDNRLWEELFITAQWYLKSLFEKDRPDFDCLYEGFSEKKNKTWMTFAGWIRHLAMALNYFTFMGVINKMENKRTYVPVMDELKPFFTEDSGINSDEKAYAFILGIIFGRVIQIQGAKGVNVAANALTWLKRLSLTGKDLPGLYVNIREKLLAYDAESVGTVRSLIKEVGRLGITLGEDIKLNKSSCCYFLLLGQSMAIDLFPKKINENGE